MRLLINRDDFLKDLEISEIKRALKLEFECLNYAKMHAQKVPELMQIANARASLEQIFAPAQVGASELVLSDLQEILIIALAKEITLVEAYKKACTLCQNEELKDLFFRLWASSVNEYQVALKNALASTFTQTNSLENTLNNFLQNIIK